MTPDHRSRKVTWLELFFDLIFVAAVAQVGEPLRHDYSIAGIVHYAALFVLIWCAWTGQALFVTRFGNDDLPQRLLTLMQVFAAAAMAANAADWSDTRTAAGFTAAYAGMRFILVVQYLRARSLVPARDVATRYAMGHGTAAALWLGSAVMPSPIRSLTWGVALVIDLMTPWLGKKQHVAVPPHASHLPERFGLFTLILFGEMVIAVMHGMESQDDWSVAAASAAFASMAIAFLLWWWYFDGASGAAERRLRSPSDVVRLRVWYYAHLPLGLGIATTGIGLQRLVRFADDFVLPRQDVGVLVVSLAITMTAIAMIGASSRMRSTAM